MASKITFCLIVVIFTTLMMLTNAKITIPKEDRDAINEAKDTVKASVDNLTDAVKTSDIVKQASEGLDKLNEKVQKGFDKVQNITV